VHIQTYIKIIIYNKLHNLQTLTLYYIIHLLYILIYTLNCMQKCVALQKYKEFNFTEISTYFAKLVP